ncbi:MAG TPA: hypothetical protein VKH82_19075 [Candidatus Binatia bacterium]|nr:hypothetical protein [Candidatus Binatia bacterium]
MIPETLRIDELLLRVPNLQPEEARRLAADVAALLARALGRTEMYPVPHGASLSVRVPPGTPHRELARVIAGQILEALR